MKSWCKEANKLFPKYSQKDKTQLELMPRAV